MPKFSQGVKNQPISSRKLNWQIYTLITLIWSQETTLVYLQRWQNHGLDHKDTPGTWWGRAWHLDLWVWIQCGCSVALNYELQGEEDAQHRTIQSLFVASLLQFRDRQKEWSTGTTLTKTRGPRTRTLVKPAGSSTLGPEKLERTRPSTGLGTTKTVPSLAQGSMRAKGLNLGPGLCFVPGRWVYLHAPHFMF